MGRGCPANSSPAKSPDDCICTWLTYVSRTAQLSPGKSQNQPSTKWVLSQVARFWGDLLAIVESHWVSLPLPSPTQERAAELAGLLRGCGQTRSCRRQSLSSLPFSHSVLFFVCFFSSHPACVGRSLGSGLPWSKCKVGSRRWVLALWCPQSRVVGLLEFHQHATGQTGICLSG